MCLSVISLNPDRVSQAFYRLADLIRIYYADQPSRRYYIRGL